MCGRYTITKPERIIVELQPAVVECAPGRPRYNVAPTQKVPVMADRQGAKTLFDCEWGLIPPWAETPAAGARLINARAETVRSKPSFRDAFRKGRCLIPADGFYEWQKTDRGNRPFYARRKDGGVLAFAGIYSHWTKRGPEGALLSCAIVTTEANGLMAPIHPRMPVILHGQDWARWLDPGLEADPAGLRGILLPFDEALMEIYPVSAYVNSPANEGERCIVRQS